MMGQDIFQSDAFWSYGVPLGTFTLLLVMGFLNLRKRVVELNKDESFAHEFRERFIAYCNSNNSEAYAYLMLNSTRMQRDMGPMGVYASFTPPAANYRISNYPIIMNMIPEIRSLIDRNQDSGFGLFGSTIDGYIKNVDEALLRHIGVLKEQSYQAFNALKNPLLWFRSGVNQILSLPLMLFVSFGLMAGSTLRALQSNYIFKTFNALVAIIGLISGAMTIILGWDQTSEILGKIFINWLKTNGG